jgi:hypothetical protein
MQVSEQALFAMVGRLVVENQMLQEQVAALTEVLKQNSGPENQEAMGPPANGQKPAAVTPGAAGVVAESVRSGSE